MTLISAYFGVAAALLVVGLAREAIRRGFDDENFCLLLGYVLLWPFSITIEFIDWLQRRANKRKRRGVR